MRLLKKVVLLPVIVLVVIMSTSMKLILKAECWVAGVGFLLLAILATLALINKMWLQLGLFASLLVIGVVIMLMSAHILFWIETLRELIQNCRND